MVLAVIGLNCVLAGLVCWLAGGLWRWRCGLREVARQLQRQSEGIGLAQQ